MIKIKVNEPAVSPKEVFIPGKVYLVDNRLGKDLINAGFAEKTDEDISFPDPTQRVHKAVLIEKPKVELKARPKAKRTRKK